MICNLRIFESIFVAITWTYWLQTCQSKRTDQFVYKSGTYTIIINFACTIIIRVFIKTGRYALSQFIAYVSTNYDMPGQSITAN